ncbi:MAG: DUF1294 domain-containing protein [Lachnospiraceae bacterium]|jgi:uncharacterized membrane protein YsdA (DUF1294 family)|nr:DUF1294 domain-containing protein [Lachnospiraceae bacterium]
MNVLIYIFAYLLFANISGFILMGVDKYKAKKKTFRIPEATLFTVALFGGSVGTWLGMYLFRHKTRHWYFVYGMPLILIIQLIIIMVFLFYVPIEFTTI